MTAIFIPPVIDNLTTASGTSSLSANQGVVLEGQIATKATDASVVHIAGTETVTGAKTFSALVKVLQSSIAGTFDAGGLQYRNSADPTRVLNFGIDTSIGTYGYAWVQAVKSGTAVMPLVFQPGGGNIGLGTSSPNATFDVRTNSTYPLTWGSTSAQIGALVYAGTTAHITGLVGDISLRPSATEVLHLSSASSGQAALISAPTAATKGLTVQGAASQSANLQEWQDSSATVLSKVDAIGALHVLPGTQASGATTVFRVQGGILGYTSDLLTIPANGYFSFGDPYGTGSSFSFDGSTFLFQNNTIVKAYSLSITNSLDTASIKGYTWFTHSISLDTVGINTLFPVSAATDKGIVVKGAASQSANLQEWQNSTGTALASIAANGDTTLTGMMTLNGVTGRNVQFIPDYSVSIQALQFDGRDAQINQFLFRNTAAGLYAAMSADSSGGFSWETASSLPLVFRPNGVGVLQLQASSQSALLTAAAAAVKALVVKGAPSQSANLQEWQDSGGSVLALVDANGRIGSGVTPTAQLHVQSRAPGYTAFIAHAAGSSIAEFWNNNVKQLTIAPSGAVSWGTTGVGYAALYMDASYVVDGAGSVTSGFGQLMRPTIRPNTGNNAFAIYTQPTVDTSVGTVANVYGLYTDAPAVTGANTVTNAYGAYFKTPTIGSTKNVGFVIETTSTADNAAEVRDSGGTLLSAIDKLGAWRPPSLTDSAAANGSLYYSTTASKLVYKDAGGTVNALY